MIQHKDHFHGSDLEKIEAIYGIKKEDIVSFSANVNPLGISTKLRNCLSEHLDAITTYPDRDYKDLKNCIGNYAGAEPEHIIVGNGSTELISLFIQITAPKKAMILGPTYSEYEREITLNGGKTKYYPLPAANDFHMDLEDFKSHLTEDLDLLILCNPNNPTSTCIRTDMMREILDVCKESSIYATQVLHLMHRNYQKVTFLIVTDKAEQICAGIHDMTHHGATIFHGEGGYEHDRHDLVYSVTSGNDVRKIKKGVREIDPSAFVNTFSSGEIMGNFYMQPKD